MDLAERLDRYIASKSRKPDPFASDTDAMRDQLTSGGMPEDQAFDLALAMARERERARDVPAENILGGDMSRLFQQDPTMMERIKRLPAQTLGAGEALASLGSAAALSVPSMVQSLVTGEKDPLGMMKRQMYVPKTEEGIGALTAVGELIPEIPAMPQVQLQALQAIPAGAAAAQAQRGLQGGLRALPDIKGDVPNVLVQEPERVAISSRSRGISELPQATVDFPIERIESVPLPGGKFATSTELVEAKKLKTAFDVAETPYQVAHITSSLRKSPQEQLVAVVVDENNKPIQIIRHTIGLSDQAAVEPFSLIGAIANTPGAKSFWLSHNHPSGKPELSNADKRLADVVTRLTKDTGIEMRGIMAIGKDRFASYGINGEEIVNEKIPAAVRDKTLSMMERTFRKTKVLDKTEIDSPNSARIIADKIAGDETGVILLNAAHQPTGFLPLKESDLLKLRSTGAAIELFKALEKANAKNVMFVSKQNIDESSLGNVQAFFDRLDARMLDALIGPKRKSIMESGGVSKKPLDFSMFIPAVGAGVLQTTPEEEQAFQTGGIVKGAVAGAKAGAKGAKQASDAAIRVSKKLEEISEKPVATPAELDKAIQQSSKRIAKDNPKLSEQEVEKKAERDVLSRFRWERIDKPSAVSDFGELVNEPYSAPLARRFRNVPSVVEERAQRAEEFLRQPTEPWTPPPPGLQAFDRSLIKEALEGFPGVEQTRFPRYQPARADVGYVGEMYDDPRNRELIKQQIMRGLPLGGETFYGSLYPLKMAALERGIPAAKFEQFVYETAPASARNSIMNEMAVGQFLRDMNARGLPLDEKTVAEEMAKFKQKYGIGLPLMPVHRQGVQQVIEGGTNLREQVKADIPTNYKIPTYGTQKAGDFGKSVVLDVHEAAGETLASPYHPYFTRQGGFGSTEYGLAEAKMLDIANELGIPGGMAQAGRWFGGGELTGLKSPRGDALDLLEKQTAYTLQGQGVKPTPKNIRNYILDMVETGEGVLMPYFKSEAMPDVRTKKKKGGLAQAFQSGGKVISLAAKAAKVAKPIAKEAVPALSTVDFADKNWRSAIDDVVKYMNNVGVPYAPWQFMRDKPDVPLGRIMDEIERDVYFVRSNPILPEGQVNVLEELFKKAREAEASYTRSGTPRNPMTGEPTMASGGLAVLRKKHGN